jgi:endonuclease YncB( thermonuclease family)
VGKILPFRRRRRWTRKSDFGGPRFWPDERKITPGGLVRDTIGWLVALRPFILLGILVSVFMAPVADPALIEPPAFLSTDPEMVDATFTRCGPGRGHACVIDGDTFKLGDRKVRIIGIDAPETHPPHCAEEARLGEAATAKLQELLNQGPFAMAGPSYGDKDRYGRDLRTLTRTAPDGSEQSIAADMRVSGLARRYLGGFKSGWG